MLGRFFYKSVFALILVAAFMSLGGHKASAAMVAFLLTPRPGNPGVPAIPIPNRDQLEHCNYKDSGNSPAYQQWIADAGTPSATSVTVPYGTTDVPLDLQWANAVCLPYNDVEEARLFTLSAVVTKVDGVDVTGNGNGLIYNAAGQILPLSSGQNYTDYRRNSYQFNYVKAGGLTQSHTYTISFLNKSVNKFKAGTPHPAYQCIDDTARPINNWNENGLCEDEIIDFPIIINVSPEPPGGNIDTAACSSVAGWAKEPNFSNKPLVVKIYQDNWPEDGGAYINQAYADINRADVGRHGFNIDISATDDAYSHKYYAVAQMLDSSGNPNGGFYHLGGEGKTVPPCVQVRCSLTTNPAQPLVNQPFDIILSYNFDKTYGSLGKPITPIFSVSYNGGPNQEWPSPSSTRDPGSHTFSGFSQSGPGGVGSSGTVYQPSVFTKSCISSFNIASAPYLKVYGNDIAAGGKFADVDETTCSPGPKTANGQPPASIWTFSKKVTSGGTYYGGASSQFGALALGQIDGFSTAGTRNGATAPTTPNDLSFGNMVKSGFWGNPASVAENGAGFSGIYRCIPDYFSASSKLPAANAVLKTGTSFINDPNNNDANDPASKLNYPIADSKRMVIFVNGDNNQYGGAYIQKNITFANTTWSDTSKIPSFYLIVKGDIFIDDDVTQLDGVYIAQPRSDGTGGHIYTCTNGGNAFPPLLVKEDLFTKCGNTLTITGSFIANQIKFQRARGTVENATAGPGALNEGPTPGNNIAEIFNFSQEMYLAPTPSILDTVIGNSTSSNVYQSITSLPPVL